MKSSSVINGLKIISIAEGQQISTVKDIILDAENGCLAYFIIDQPSDYLGARLIAYNDILGLGDYALIIPNRDVIQDVAHCLVGIDLIKKDIKVIGAQVLSEKGSLIGEVTEIMINEETGRIAVCQVTDPQGSISEIKCDKVIKYGKNIIILGDSPSKEGQAQVLKEKIKVQPSEKVQPIDRFQPLDKFQPLEKTINEKEILKKRIEEFGKSDNLLKTAVIANSLNYPEDFNVFEQRQLQFLLGKTLNTSVNLDNGQVLSAGQQITTEDLSAVKTRNTLMQITAHVVK
ncbi:MAG: hypothetical protein APF84_19005 [Gracilibacter sp. BRH_c7a]|nr:MAG: hypothetical protein APF84_19005 [Gracilibacter sp. BRH_c7a]